MVTSVIGRIFLDAYNTKFETEHTPQSFFLEVYCPLFFASDKYFLWATNSPMVQSVSQKDSTTKKQKKNSTEETEEDKQRKELFKRIDELPIEDSGIKERIKKLVNKIEFEKKFDASTAIGYQAELPQATTSGQLSLPSLQIKPEEAYLSWIGTGLGIGIQGGMCILFLRADILLDIFEGWKLYRQYLSNNPHLKGNQIETWNGQWLGTLYKANKRTPSAIKQGAFALKGSVMNIETIHWFSVVSGLSHHYNDPKVMAYVYNISQMNTTIGFMPLRLSKIKKTVDLYDRLFPAMRSDCVEELFGTALGFKVCCKEGSIGVKAMEPKGLRAYMDKKKMKMPTIKDNDQAQRIKYSIYQTWLIAMLNNEDLWKKANDFAAALSTYIKGDKSTKTVRTNQIKQLLEAFNKKSFIERMTPIIGESEDKTQLEEVASIVNLMPSDNVPYFLTLIKFHYALINNTKGASDKSAQPQCVDPSDEQTDDTINE